MRQVAALYARLSRRQDEKVATCATQIRRLRDEAKRRGLNVAHEFVDDGISAYSGKERPGFAGLMEAIVSGEVDHVLAVRMDRFSRDEVEGALFRSACRKAGVTIVAEGRETAPDDEAGGLVATIEAWSAFTESSKKSKRVREAKAIARERGLYTGTPRPFGYQNRDKAHPEIPKGSLVIVPEEAQAIRDGVEWIFEGRGLRFIAQEWNRRGVTRPRGGEWDHGLVHRLLVDDRIAGLYDGRTAAWEPIITPEKFYEVGALLKARSTGGGGPRGQGLLSGLATCGECGARMGRKRERSGSRPWLYVCRGCEKNAAVAEHVDRIVSEDFLALVSDPKFVRKMLDAIEGEHSDDLRTLLREREEIEERLGDLMAEYVTASGATRSAVKKAQRTAELRIAEIAKEVERRSSPLALTTPPDEILATWEDAEVEQQRSWLVALLDHVVIHRAHKRGGRGNFNPERVDPVWRI